MDCLEACEVISAAHDGELVDAALLEQARLHAGSCTACGAFAGMLERIASAPAPRAPEDLIARLEELSAVAAEGIREASAPQPEPEPVLVHEHPRPARWLPRFTAFASAAAVLLVALTVGSIALMNRTGQEAVESTDRTLGESELAAPAAEDGTAGASADVTTAVVTQPSPAYVSLDSAVWLLAGPAVPEPSVLATAGVVTSALDGQDLTDHPAYFAGTDRSVLYVRTSDGRLLVFERVVRTLGRAPYGLMTGTPIRAFGTWPTLPERLGRPEDDDGTPAFTLFGFDDSGRDVFLPAGQRISDGFALAPGTPADDPAAGNPNWTWWERIE